MADIYITSEPPTIIDYHIGSGTIREFTLKGKKLYDKAEGIAIEGWKEELINIVEDYSMNVDYGPGCSAFVYTLEEEGLIDIHNV